MKLTARAFVGLQFILPQHAISRLVRLATRIRTPWVKNCLIRGFLRWYAVNMREAEVPDPLAFGSFNEFFTRSLRAEVRPIAAQPDAIASPVDGMVSECGAIDGDRLLQAKGRAYRLGDLLAGQPWAQNFLGGRFVTIYLAPHNYHRIHMPVSGTLLATVYVPGRLFSVNAATAALVPRLFARNERVLTLFNTAVGRMGVVMVGALNVGSMATVWGGDITPAKKRQVTVLPPADVALGKGAELGRFNMGSTVIVLFEPERVRLAAHLQAGSEVKVGEIIGTALVSAGA